MMKSEDRYQHDPIFRALVDLLGSFLEQNAMQQWTPTELREAVLLAACRYEMLHVRPLIVPSPYDLEAMRPERRTK